MAAGDKAYSGKTASGQWATEINRIAGLGGISTVTAANYAQGATITKSSIDTLIDRLNSMKTDTYWKTKSYYANIPAKPTQYTLIQEGTRSRMQTTMNNIANIKCRNQKAGYTSYSTCSNSKHTEGCYQGGCGSFYGNQYCPASCLSGEGCYKSNYNGMYCTGFYCSNGSCGAYMGCNHYYSSCNNGTTGTYHAPYIDITCNNK